MSSTTVPQPQGVLRAALLRNEDWWAVGIGLAIVAVAWGLFARGSSIGWIAVTPPHWSSFSALGTKLLADAPRYLALLVTWALPFGLAAGAMGMELRKFLASFTLLFVLASLIFALGQWEQAAHYNLEPPLVALALGLVVANASPLPNWFQEGLRVELYVKVGIVLLGATLPFTLVLWAGPVAIAQAAIVSLATFGTIFWVGRRLGLEPRFAATLGAGGAVCGVSGSIAIAGAVGARKEHASMSITLVILWAIAFIFLLPLVARALGLHTGVAGAWIGTSEFADAAGLAAAQTYAGYAGHVAGIAGTPDAALSAYTLMKVIGRDVWIGIWALVLSIVATTYWRDDAPNTRLGGTEVWRRFPKFVLGFLLASLVVTLVSHGDGFAAYKSHLVPLLVGPIQVLRTWAFIFCFLSIGLTTRLRDLTRAARAPFLAFSAGAAVNIVLGFVLSTQVFGSFWTGLGQ